MIPTQPIIVLIVIIIGGVKFPVKIEEPFFSFVQNALLNTKLVEFTLASFSHGKISMLTVSKHPMCVYVCRTYSAFAVQAVKLMISNRPFY